VRRGIAGSGVRVSKILIQPSWTFTSESGETVDPQLFRLLRAVHEARKLTVAAREVGLSYRHCWDLLARWAQFFGTPLVKMARGKGAELTALGQKLLWAEQRSQASLFPQLENIASELNREIGRALKEAPAPIRIHASYGYAVEKLAPLMREHGHAEVDIQYMSSVAALASLARRDCGLAGFHVPLGELGLTLWEHYEQWLRPRQQRIVRMVTRTQGLIVPRGNPRRVRTLHDLARPGVRFVNRQAGSGTRFLLDGLMQRQGIATGDIAGYDSGEFTHAAVAAFVASGMADIGFGIEPAARQFKLDFVPLVQERYLLACHKDSLRLAPVRELIALLQQPVFAERIAAVPGYAPDAPGTVATVNEVFPWAT
jgi:molybdate transport repressor ModE-like protein